MSKTIPAAAPPELALPLFSGFKRSGVAVYLPRSPFSSPAAVFTGALDRTVYTFDDRARCLEGRDHAAPHPKCRCGFYALTEKEPVVDGHFSGASASSGSTAVLTVNLYGDITEGTRGLRASHQKVTRVEFDPACRSCAAPDVTHVELTKPLRRLDRSLRRAVPVCQPCASKAEYAFTFAQLSEMLGGVEVTAGVGRRSFFAKLAERWATADTLRGRLRAILPAFAPPKAAWPVLASLPLFLLNFTPEGIPYSLATAALASVAAHVAHIWGRRLWFRLGWALTLLGTLLVFLPVQWDTAAHMEAHRPVAAVRTATREMRSLAARPGPTTLDELIRAADSVEGISVSTHPSETYGEFSLALSPEFRPTDSAVAGVLATRAPDGSGDDCWSWKFEARFVGNAYPIKFFRSDATPDGGCAAWDPAWGAAP